MPKAKEKKMSKAETERRRLARNEYSRKWKAEHPDQVKKWNREWLKAQKKVAAKKNAAARKQRKARPAVASPDTGEKKAA